MNSATMYSVIPTSGSGVMIESDQNEGHQSLLPFVENAIDSIEGYAREKPWSFALWMIGVGFVVGWKIKPW